MKRARDRFKHKSGCFGCGAKIAPGTCYCEQCTHEHNKQGFLKNVLHELEEPRSRGFLSIENMVFLFVAIILLGTMSPVLAEFINIGVGSTNSTITQTLFNMILPMLVIGVFIVIFSGRQSNVQSYMGGGY